MIGDVNYRIVIDNVSLAACPNQEELMSITYNFNGQVALVTGAAKGMKHELRVMRDQGSGAIVNCSSLGGLVGLPQRAPESCLAVAAFAGMDLAEAGTTRTGARRAGN